MPELPEVETIKRQLTKDLPYEILEVAVSKFVKSILKTKIDVESDSIISIDRHGKFLIFNLKGGRHLLSHLGMSGSWRISNYPSKEKHTHVSLKTRNCYLYYVDPRRFGNMYLISSKDLKKKLETLGPDPLKEKLEQPFLEKIIKEHPYKELKPMLLEQNLIAGIGNYMASEICARARISPLRSLKKIKREEIKLILKAIDDVIALAISGQGTTFLGGYIDTTGSKGEGKLHLVVFRQKVCGLCKKSEIKSLTQKSRTTFYCPKCQK